MNNVTGVDNIKNWTCAKNETGTIAEEVKKNRKPLKVDAEIKSINAIIEKLEKKYEEHPSKDIYDSITSLKESIKSLEVILS